MRKISCSEIGDLRIHFELKLTYDYFYYKCIGYKQYFPQHI